MGCGAFPRSEHHNWESYPWWREELRETFEQAEEKHWSSVHEQRAEEARETIRASIEATQQRREEYAEWLRTSQEWKEIRRLVLWRSRERCEACLNATATVVHHLTYEFGKLPPAWQLKALCSQCHERMHSGDDEWCAIGMARNSNDPIDESA